MGVFHQGIPINTDLISLFQSLPSTNKNLIMEQNPIGGWNPVLEKMVFGLHGISFAQIIRNEKLSCLQKIEAQFVKISPAHASMYTTGPAAFVLMIAQPRVEKYPQVTTPYGLTVEQWLYNDFVLQKNKVVFLENHFDVYARLKNFSAAELAKISEDYCKGIETGLIEKNKGVLDFQLVVNYFNNGEFDKLKTYTLSLLKTIGWSEKILKNQYEDREASFAEKISAKLKNSNEQFIITVGAAHIGGSAGLLELLKIRGFKITKCYSSDFTSCIKK